MAMRALVKLGKSAAFDKTNATTPRHDCRLLPAASAANRTSIDCRYKRIPLIRPGIPLIPSKTSAYAPTKLAMRLSTFSMFSTLVA